jgi:hypothetical protein
LDLKCIRPKFLTATGINHAFSTARHDVDSVVKTTAMSFEFVKITATVDSFEYPVSLALEHRPGFLTTCSIERWNIEVEVGIRVRGTVVT